jgi:thiol-disulfide isomerase/thioredoxin
MTMLVKIVIGIAVGAALGGLLGSTRSCKDGGCPLTANPTRGALIGALLGFLVSAQFSVGSGGMSEGVTREASPQAPGSSIVECSTREELTDLLKARTGTTLVVFSAPWCRACRTYEPVLKAVAAQGHGDKIIKVNADRAKDLSREVGVQYLPTTLIYEAGEEVNRFVGGKPEEEVLELVNG